MGRLRPPGQPAANADTGLRSPGGDRVSVMALWTIPKSPQLASNIVDPGIAVSVDEVEHPSHNGPPRQSAGEDQSAHRAEADRRIDPVLQPEMLDRCSPATDAGDDRAASASDTRASRTTAATRKVPASASNASRARAATRTTISDGKAAPLPDTRASRTRPLTRNTCGPVSNASRASLAARMAVMTRSSAPRSRRSGPRPSRPHRCSGQPGRSCLATHRSPLGRCRSSHPNWWCHSTSSESRASATHTPLAGCCPLTATV